MAEYLLPDVGEGLTEAELVSWKVQVGDEVAINDVVCEIETAKSIVELPSPYAGVVTALLVAEGVTVNVGTPIIAIGEAGAAGGGAGGAAPRHLGEPEVIDTNIPPEGNVTLVGYGPREEGVRRRKRVAPGAGAAVAEAAAGAGAGASGDAGAVVAEADAGAAAPIAATPSAAAETVRALAKPPVRKLAKDLGVNLLSVTPTGPDGTVTRADVEAAAGGGGAVAAGSPEGFAAPERAAYVGGERREPIKGVRKMMAQAMVGSAFTAPHVTEWVTLDATRTVDFVARLKGRRDFRDVKVSPMLIVARACLLAVRRTPEINSTWDEAAGEVVYKDYVNLGFAAATPRGLVVPNIKSAERLGLVELAESINAAARTAREGRTQPADMTGGSFTITNVGVFGIDSGTPIINPGESAILAMGAIRKQPWVVTSRDDSGRDHDEIAVRHVMTLALSFDHRHIDGALGSQFLADVAAIIEDPATALLF